MLIRRDLFGMVYIIGIIIRFSGLDFDRETAKIDRLKGRVVNAVENLGEYRVALISGVVTGNADVHKEQVKEVFA